MGSTKPGLNIPTSFECSTEANYIHIGLQIKKWPFLTPYIIQSFVDNPELLDAEDEALVEDFHAEHEAFCEARRFKGRSNAKREVLK